MRFQNMPMFHYEAADKSGKTVIGSMDARDEGAVRARLAQGGYTPLLIETANRGKAPAGRARAAARPAGGNTAQAGAPPDTWGARNTPVTPGVGEPTAGSAYATITGGTVATPAKSARRAGVVVPPRALAQFYRQMASMLKSGVPITQALPQLAAGERNRVLRAALKDMEASVAAGHPLSDAMARHPRAFSPGHVGLIRSGEAAGFLDRAMEELAVQVEANWGLQNQFNLTVLYGKALLVPFFIGFLYLMAHVQSLSNAPGNKIDAVLVLVGKSALVGILAALAINVFIPLAWRGLRSTSFGGGIDGLVSRMPLLGATRRKNDRVRTLSSLGSSLTAGIPLYMAWTLAAEAAETAYTRQRMMQYAPLLNRGEPLPDVMAATGIYDANTMQLARSGALAGNLPEMLTQAAGYQREQVNYETKRNSTVFGFLFILLIILGVAGYIITFWIGRYFGSGGILNGGGMGFLPPL